MPSPRSLTTLPASSGRVLERLLAVTDRVCDCGSGKVSPVYTAVLRDQVEIVGILLREGYSPDAQECPDYGYSSPLAAALSTSAMRYCVHACEHFSLSLSRACSCV